MCIESFLRYIRYEKNFSSHTVLSYRNDLLQFVDYYVACKDERFAPKSVDQDLVRNWHSIYPEITKGEDASVY